MRLTRTSSRLGVSSLLVCLLCAVNAVQAQDEHRRTKVPLIGKIGGGANRQAFSGIVKSVDIKRKLLLVDTVEGGITEYFPVKKDFQVSTAGGKRIKLSEVAPGTNVIVYFSVSNDRREVTDILVLGSKDRDKTQEEAKKPSSPS